MLKKKKPSKSSFTGPRNRFNRHIVRLGEENGTYYFDHEAADRVVRWFPAFLRHSKGEYAGQPFHLSPWQEHDIVRPLFGWKRVKDGKRRFRRAWVEIPKKNGKSTLCAGLAAYMLLGDGENGAEVYSAGCDQEQARIIFKQCREMFDTSPFLRSGCEILRNTIYNRKTKSVYRALTSEVGGNDGLNSSAVFFDEIHRQKNRHLWDVLEYSTSARRQPLIMAITTAGLYDPQSIYYELHTHAQSVIDGTKTDPAWFSYIRAAQKGADWSSRRLWLQVNPEIGHAKTMDSMEDAYAKAAGTPANENNFKRLHLNMITEQVTRYLPMAHWDKCDKPVSIDDFEGELCFAGLDLSTTQDLTALVLLFPPNAEKGREGHTVFPFFWLPKDEIKEREQHDRVPYSAWSEQGLIHLTEGNTVDYGAVTSKILELKERFNIKEVAYDTWNAVQLATEWYNEHGIAMVEFRQGWVSMNEPTKFLLKLTLEHLFFHGGHPILQWNAANLSVKTDPSANVRPVKENETLKIDGVVASIMALGRCIVHTREQPPVYLERGLRVL